jgi:hypothetical protein
MNIQIVGWDLKQVPGPTDETTRAANYAVARVVSRCISMTIMRMLISLFPYVLQTSSLVAMTFSANVSG